MTKNETNQKNATKSEKIIILLALSIVLLFGVIAILISSQSSTLSSDIPQESRALAEELKEEYNYAYRGLTRYIGNDENGDLDKDIEVIAFYTLPNIEYVEVPTTLETYDGSIVNIPSFYNDSDEQRAEWYILDTYGIELSDESLIETSYIGEIVEITYSGVNGLETVYVFPEINSSSAFVRITDLNNTNGDIEF